MAYDVRGRDDKIFTVGKSLVELTSEATSSLLRNNHLELVESVRVAGHGFPFIGGAERRFCKIIRRAAQEFDAEYAWAKYIVASGRNLDDYVSAVVDFYKKV